MFKPWILSSANLRYLIEGIVLSNVSSYYTENNNLQHLFYVMKINISRVGLQRKIIVLCYINNTGALSVACFKTVSASVLYLLLSVMEIDGSVSGNVNK